ncbi:hypothetical protein DFP72DRAFT_1072956 [Ephemerocybe angulata]|uniref:Nephrocystin 3-like N-terminal domain-containing protein n=1 Tax=Ephemerocybe angulata TaxID=980116 RepID=A0A8H6HMF3_9AGAR|nr:hypothetical protein DFP72DRAFT_1072956 [Tulosesus angulatus]
MSSSTLKSLLKAFKSKKPKKSGSNLQPVDSVSTGVVDSTIQASSSSPTASNDPTGALSFFNNASNFQIQDFKYVEVKNQASAKSPGWDLLVEKTAHTALYDSAARFDRPKCDDDTRVEVLSEIMGWVQDQEAPTRLLCMTGPAGAGKSAIQQTIAEQCSRLGILAASFFFGANDEARNDALPVAATIAYQLCLTSATLRSSISAVVDRDPLIFTKSIEKQVTTLIVNPVLHLQAANLSLVDLPYVILIDGLDECKTEERQAELLEAIDSCITSNKLLPFRVFVASRPELVIFNALQPYGHLHQVAYHIQLDNKYNPDFDIERYFRRRFRVIARRCRDLQAQGHLWPSQTDLTSLVVAASGQFIYAATVVRYVEEPRGSPVNRLKAVLSWTLGATTSHPLSSLDELYRQILLKARQNYRDVDNSREDLVMLIRMAHDTLLRECYNRDKILFSELGGVDSLLYDLRSLLFISRPSEETDKLPTEGAQKPVALQAHHWTFIEFLSDERRAKDLFVCAGEYTDYAAGSCLAYVDRIIACDEGTVRKDNPMLSSCAWIFHHLISTSWMGLRTIGAIERLLELNWWDWLSLDYTPMGGKLVYHYCIIIPMVQHALSYRYNRPELGKQLAASWETWVRSSGILDLYRRKTRPASPPDFQECERCGLVVVKDRPDAVLCAPRQVTFDAPPSLPPPSSL